MTSKMWQDLMRQRQKSGIVDFLKIPKKTLTWEAKIPKGVLLVGPPGTERLCWQRQWQEKPMCPFSPCQESELC
jgi:ATP-dependent Zn protease